MPDINGDEVLSRAASASHAAVRIVATGYADTDMALRAINSGNASSYMTKPMSADRLRAVASEALAIYNRRSKVRSVLASLKAASRDLQQVLRKIDTDPRSA